MNTIEIHRAFADGKIDEAEYRRLVDARLASHAGAGKATFVTRIRRAEKIYGVK